MLLNSSALRVLRRSTWTSPDEAQKLAAAGASEKVVTWRSGVLVEYGEFYDETTGSILTATLDESINGEVAVGDVVQLTLEMSVEKRAVGRGGNTVDKHKFKVVGAKPVGEPASK